MTPKEITEWLRDLVVIDEVGSNNGTAREAAALIERLLLGHAFKQSLYMDNPLTEEVAVSLCREVVGQLQPGYIADKYAAMYRHAWRQKARAIAAQES